MDLQRHLQKAKEAKSVVANLAHSIRIDFLKACAKNLLALKEEILEANKKDLENARVNHLSFAMLERLELNSEKIENMAKSLCEIADFSDPLNKVLSGFNNHCDLKIEKVSVPLGVIAIIYESRPNVTSDTAGLCFKSGNVCILKGGKEAQNSNEAIMKVFSKALRDFDLPQEAITLLPFMQNREELKELLNAEKYIDLLIPRGGEGLISFVNTHSKIPVIKHDKGVCHIFAHKSCKQDLAINVIVNAKTSRPSTCNACETLLVDSAFADSFLLEVAKALCEKNTILKGCEQTCAILEKIKIPCEKIDLAAYHTEYNDNILNIRIVEGLEGALAHIREFSSGHSEAILCEDYSIAEAFLERVDSACVYVNASTRFSDGGEFGYGAEVGISTSKLHARGPMGVDTLTTYKYKIRGSGQVRK